MGTPPHLPDRLRGQRRGLGRVVSGDRRPRGDGTWWETPPAVYQEEGGGAGAIEEEAAGLQPPSQAALLLPLRGSDCHIRCQRGQYRHPRPDKKGGGLVVWRTDRRKWQLDSFPYARELTP